MGSAEAKLALQRRNMVERQLRARGIVNQRVLEAFGELPRERFVPPGKLSDTYGDFPVAIGCGQTISQPFITALMLQELDVRENHRVLDVGAGSGYQTALLAKLCRWVYAIERIEPIAAAAQARLEALDIPNVTFRVGDGSAGWADEAPFDRIVCGAAGPNLPKSWEEQLADGGRIVAPIGGLDSQTLVAVDRQGRDFKTRHICDVRFVRLIGREAWPGD